MQRYDMTIDSLGDIKAEIDDNGFWVRFRDAQDIINKTATRCAEIAENSPYESISYFIHKEFDL